LLPYGIENGYRLWVEKGRNVEAAIFRNRKDKAKESR
jgi:hypothetical protein